jgi:hypothetical protein
MTESMLARARECAGWDSVRAKLEFEKSRNNALSNDGRSHDWEARWALWIERDLEYDAKKAQQHTTVIDQEGIRCSRGFGDDL